ncbi:MAG: hypothetical protein J5691_01610 [Bacilli bacterium]|nr:hypothetical protein [Bacilli bacterium]
MKKWKIKEATFNSLKELNEYIAENDIAPSNLIKYDTIYESLKQKTRYVITYWSIKE